MIRTNNDIEDIDLKQIRKQFNYARISCVAFLFFIVACLFSCRSHQLSYISETGSINKLSHQEVIQKVLSSELKYKTLNTKAKMRLGKEESTAFLKLVKDSLIQISIRPKLGVEALRMDIMPQRVVIINRINKYYVDVAKDGLDETNILFSFYNLQSLLTNRLFLAGEENASEFDYSKSFKMETFPDSYLLYYQNKDKTSTHFIVDADFRIKQIDIDKKNASKKKGFHNFQLESNYSNFVEDESHNVYPTLIRIKTQYEDIKNNYSINFKQWDINKEFSIDLKIPKNYKRLNGINEFFSSFD